MEGPVIPSGCNHLLRACSFRPLHSVIQERRERLKDPKNPLVQKKKKLGCYYCDRDIIKDSLVPATHIQKILDATKNENLVMVYLFGTKIYKTPDDYNKGNVLLDLDEKQTDLVSILSERSYNTFDKTFTNQEKIIPKDLPQTSLNVTKIPYTEEQQQKYQAFLASKKRRIENSNAQTTNQTKDLEENLSKKQIGQPIMTSIPSSTVPNAQIIRFTMSSNTNTSAINQPTNQNSSISVPNQIPVAQIPIENVFGFPEQLYQPPVVNVPPGIGSSPYLPTAFVPVTQSNASSALAKQISSDIQERKQRDVTIQELKNVDKKLCSIRIGLYNRILASQKNALLPKNLIAHMIGLWERMHNEIDSIPTPSIPPQNDNDSIIEVVQDE